jgi:Protein of unknown function (DUF559)
VAALWPAMRNRPWRYAELRDAGVSRAGVRRLVRLHRGIYLGQQPEGLDILRGLFLRLPEGVLLTMRSAAHLYGFGDPSGAVHVLVPRGINRPRIEGVLTYEAVLPVPAPVRIAGIPCVPPARCAVDLVRHLPRLLALPVLDAALRCAACTEAELLAEVHRHAGLRRVRQARELVLLADPRAECVQESQLRLVLVDAGLPAPEPQVWVEDRYRIDLAYRHRRIGIEYDGRSHLDRARLATDRARMNWLDSRGWTMRYFTARDLYDRPGQLVATVRAALA